MFILNASADSKVDDKTVQRSALMLRLKDGIGSLARILKTIEVRSERFRRKFTGFAFRSDSMRVS